jgi:prepilin-type processing-associated H-X9-DG protein
MQNGREGSNPFAAVLFCGGHVAQRSFTKLCEMAPSLPACSTSR